MTAAEAAEAARIIKPKTAVPMHFGSIVGSSSDAAQFAALLKDLLMWLSCRGVAPRYSHRCSEERPVTERPRSDDVLSTLRNHPDFVSGADIASSLGITRAAVWKQIAKLRDSGYTIDASPAKG